MIQPHWSRVPAEVEQSDIKHNLLSLPECFTTPSQFMLVVRTERSSKLAECSSHIQLLFFDCKEPQRDALYTDS